MRYWLMKSEPSDCSVDDAAAAPNATVPWVGVRNFQARNFMPIAIQPLTADIAVAGRHVVAHEVARLEVAHADPGDARVRCCRRIVDRALARLALHQPVAHRWGTSGEE